MFYYTPNFDSYEHYINGKHNQVIISVSATKVDGILELVHIYVFGSMLIPSLGKHVYHFSFMDDFSWNVRIYFLWNKFHSFCKFKDFKAFVETYIENKIKVLKTKRMESFIKMYSSNSIRSVV